MKVKNENVVNKLTTQTINKATPNCDATEQLGYQGPVANAFYLLKQWRFVSLMFIIITFGNNYLKAQTQDGSSAANAIILESANDESEMALNEKRIENAIGTKWVKFVANNANASLILRAINGNSSTFAVTIYNSSMIAMPSTNLDFITNSNDNASLQITGLLTGQTYYASVVASNATAQTTIPIVFSQNYNTSITQCSSQITNVVNNGALVNLSATVPNLPTVLGNAYSSSAAINSGIYSATITNSVAGKIIKLSMDIFNPFYDASNSASMSPTHVLPTIGVYINGTLIKKLDCNLKYNSTNVRYNTFITDNTNPVYNLSLRIENPNNWGAFLLNNVYIETGETTGIQLNCGGGFEFTSFENNTANDANNGSTVSVQYDPTNTGNFITLTPASNSPTLATAGMNGSQYGYVNNLQFINGNTLTTNIPNTSTTNIIYYKKIVFSIPTSITSCPVKFIYSNAVNIGGVVNTICSNPSEYTFNYTLRNQPSITSSTGTVNSNGIFVASIAPSSSITLTGTNCSIYKWRKTSTSSNINLGNTPSIAIIKDCDNISYFELENEYKCVIKAQIISTPAKPQPQLTQVNSNSIKCNGSNLSNCTYAWSLNSIPLTQSTQTIPICENGTYQCVVTNAYGCTGTASLIVTNQASYILSQVGNILTAPSGASYSWSPNGETTQSINVCTSQSNTSYYCTVTNSNGCTANTNAIVFSLPTIQAASITQNTSTFVATANFANAASYLWSNGATTQSITPAVAGMYTCTIINNNGCSITISLALVVNPCAVGTVYQNGSTIASGNVTGQTISILGTASMSSNATYTNCDFLMTSGSKINITNNAEIITNHCHFYNCTDMWRGIEVAAGSKIIIENNSKIEGAEIGVLVNNYNTNPVNYSIDATFYMNDISGIKATNSTFDKNYICIKIVAPNFTLSNNIYQVDYHSWFWGPIAGCIFDCSGSLPNPYSGQPNILGSKTYAGIVFDKIFCTNCFYCFEYGTFNFIGHNLFNNLNFGIYTNNGAYVDMNSYQSFTNITADPIYAINERESGTAIYSISAPTASWFHVSGNNFDVCDNGILNFNKSYSTIRENNLLNINRIAIGVTNSVKLDINSNAIETKYIGIFNSTSVGTSIASNIDNNVITNIASGNTNAMGILLGGLNSYVGRSNNVTRNTINMNSSKYIAGIRAVNCSTLKVGNGFSTKNKIYLNNLHNTSTMNRAYGIRLENCPNPIVASNTVSGDNIVNAANKRAISLSMCTDATVKCNSTDKTEVGLNFMSANGNLCKIQTNELNDHNIGMLYDASAITGPQFNHGNKWLGTNYTNGAKFDMVNSNTNFTASFYKYNQATPNALAPNIPSNNNGWFTQNYFNDAICVSNNLNNTNLLNAITSGDVQAATSQLLNIDYEAVTNYKLDADLMDKLKRDPQLIATMQEIQDFYDANYNSPLERLSETKNIEQQLSATATAKLAEISTKINDLETILTAQTTANFDPTAMVTIQDLLAEINALEETVMVEKVQKAIDAKAINDNISSYKNYEENERIFNSIRLEKFINNSDLDPTDKSALQTIAWQCPYEGGPAVFNARALLASIGIIEDYDDVAMCSLAGISARVAHTNTNNSLVNEEGLQLEDIKEKLIATKLFLNQNILTIASSQMVSSNCTIKINDATGREVLNTILNAKTGVQKLDVATLNNGVYVALLLDNNGNLVQQQKICIAKQN